MAHLFMLNTNNFNRDLHAIKCIFTTLVDGDLVKFTRNLLSSHKAGCLAGSTFDQNHLSIPLKQFSNENSYVNNDATLYNAKIK